MAIAAPPAPAPTTTPTLTYNGIFLRNNLNSSGVIPSSGPYNLCPDIIQSDVSLSDPQDSLSTPQSWATLYATDPVLGATNYYYLRGLNGATSAQKAQVGLFYTPAQLILFPSTWKHNELTTATGSETVEVSGAPGHIGVGADAFVWRAAPAPPDDGDFYAFVAQAVTGNTPNPIPTITSWLDMASLLSNDLGFGFRNMCYVDGSLSTWYHRVGLQIPDSLSSATELSLTVTASGFINDTIGVLADLFGSNQQPMMISPTKISNDSFMVGTRISVEPGLETSFAVQYWNTSGNQPTPGSTISIEVIYSVPAQQLMDAARRMVLARGRAARLEKIGVGPQPVAVLGSTAFVVAPLSS